VFTAIVQAAIMDETAWTVLPAAQRGESKELTPRCSPHSLDNRTHWG
jgi:hypothetical protein